VRGVVRPPQCGPTLLRLQQHTDGLGAYINGVITTILDLLHCLTLRMTISLVSPIAAYCNVDQTQGHLDATTHMNYLLTPMLSMIEWLHPAVVGKATQSLVHFQKWAINKEHYGGRCWQSPARGMA